MLSIESLTSTQLAEIQRLTYESILGTDVIKWSQANGYNADNISLPIAKNKELIKLVNSITGYTQKDITSLHFIRYVEGTSLTRHKDEVMLDIKNPVGSISIVFLLKMCETGGEFLLNDIDINFNTPGQYVKFEGQSTYHEVKQITKGVREVLVLWYKPQFNKNSSLI